MAQQRHAARLAGRAPPSLLECAELLCTQATTADAARGGCGPTAEAQALVSGHLAALVDLLPRSDLEELGRLVGLLRDMRLTVGREPLPQAVQRLLLESGLAAWVHRQQEAAELAGEASNMNGGAYGMAGHECGEQLPSRLLVVLMKARQLAAEWQQQGSQHATTPGSDSWASWLEGGLQSDGEEAVPASATQQKQQRRQQQQGVELVRELLVRLAGETTVDSVADMAGTGSATQQAQQAQRCSVDPGAFTISTIHAAKGLEWDVVLLPSVCDGHLPVPYRPSAAQQPAAAAEEAAHHCAAAGAHYEEERRLLHVAATRARDLLLLSYVQPVPAEEAAEGGYQLPGARGTGR